MLGFLGESMEQFLVRNHRSRRYWNVWIGDWWKERQEHGLATYSLLTIHWHKIPSGRWDMTGNSANVGDVDQQRPLGYSWVGGSAEYRLPRVKRPKSLIRCSRPRGKLTDEIQGLLTKETRHSSGCSLGLIGFLNLFFIVMLDFQLLAYFSLPMETAPMPRAEDDVLKLL